MCGIIGYCGGDDATHKTFEGLKRLDYRGYDSWGVATWLDGSIKVEKATGILGETNYEGWVNSKTKLAIGHTRWATHGKVSVTNAHPHLSPTRGFAVVHNGVVENYSRLKKDLEDQGLEFVTETDTEVIVWCLELAVKAGKTWLEAIEQTVRRIEGRNSFALLTRDGEIWAMRNGSPLVVGRLGDTNEYWISSDLASLMGYVDEYLMMDNGQAVTLNSQVHLYDLYTMKLLRPKLRPLVTTKIRADKGKYEHYMLKEIEESGEVVRAVVDQDKTRIHTLVRAIAEAKRIYCIGSGTAGIAAAALAENLRRVGGVEAVELIGAEAKSWLPFMNEKSLVIAPSQSGETADVLVVLEEAKKRGVKIATYVNMPGSMMSSLADWSFMANAGVERCVMSTKVFVSQLTFGYLLAKAVAGRYEEGMATLQKAASLIDAYLIDAKMRNELRDLADRWKDMEEVILMGTGLGYHIAREGMVKLVEGAYIHAQAIPAGDLKHYAITLMDEEMWVVAINVSNRISKQMENAVSEVRARGARVVGVGLFEKSMVDVTLRVPKLDEAQELLSILPLQMLAYYSARIRGHAIDKPRNIAKSVTVL